MELALLESSSSSLTISRSTSLARRKRLLALLLLCVACCLITLGLLESSCLLLSRKLLLLRRGRASQYESAGPDGLSEVHGRARLVQVKEVSLIEDPASVESRMLAKVRLVPLLGGDLDGESAVSRLGYQVLKFCAEILYRYTILEKCFHNVFVRCGTVTPENVHLFLKGTTDVPPKYKVLRQQDLVASRQLPSALIIGVKKGGTRALLEFMRPHPGIRAAGSEIHFFDHHYSKGFHWYRHRMPTTLEGQITMEKTPSYFVTAEAPRRVHLMNPGMKLIVVVRDPVTRAISDYTQVKSKRIDMPKFEELAFVNGSEVVDTTWSPLRIGMYAKYLERWLNYFPLSQLLFVSGERLISDPALEIARVQDFLGLKRLISEKHFYFNATKGFPCLLKSEQRATPHCLGKNKGRNHPSIDPTVIKRLRDFYRPFNRRFYQLTGIDFGWP
ncbi:hypothetical protein QAD02_006919 [Eretmocerus hayati]|uniref:Uncharacterized protein n=1 Tax=Eretmocerus hayati TaxID=131215 RepID=A0ACC2N2L1_9HYME|nr:hypothetical protein QAD02_006919 [Eretmocerus hayati]